MQLPCFTEPFTQHCEVMIFLKNKSLKIDNPKQLIGKKVGTVQNFTFPSYSHYFSNNSIYRVSASNEKGVLNMLKYGRSDLAFMDEIVASHLIKTKYNNEFELKNTFDCVPHHIYV